MEYSKVRNKEEKQQWKTALRLLRDIEPVLSDPKKSAGLIQKAKAFFENSSVDRLRKLARILTEGMDAKQLLCAIVPVERVAARERVTDADMKLVSHDAASAPAASDVLPLILVADNIRSAVNIGGMFRTLEFFNAQAVWLCGYTATPEHANVAKSAMGTEKILQWRTFINIRDAVTELQESEITIYALETTTGAKDIAKVEFKLPAALLVGNERFGLDPEVLQLADEVVSIHRYGIKNSLNVVSATAIAVHAINLYKTSLPRNTP